MYKRQANQVLEQDPLPGADAKRGRKIRVVVSGQTGQAQAGGAVVAPTAAQEVKMKMCIRDSDKTLCQFMTTDGKD